MPSKAKPFSLRDVIAWLRTMKPRERYNPSNTGKCLIGHYVAARGGILDDHEGEYIIGKYSRRTTPTTENALAKISYSTKGPHTFGAALSRALKMQKEIHGG